MSSAAPDLTYFGQQAEQSSTRDQVTPYKVALLVLIEELLKNESRSAREQDVVSEQEERDIMVLLLQLVQVILFG